MSSLDPRQLLLPLSGQQPLFEMPAMPSHDHFESLLQSPEYEEFRKRLEKRCAPYDTPITQEVLDLLVD